MKLIYLAHPFSGKAENVENAERILRQLMREYPDYVFYSPLHATGFYYHDIPYDVGMEHCLEMLRRCDELWLCEGWEDSRGCSIEYSYAKGTGMPICEVITRTARPSVIAETGERAMLGRRRRK